MPYQIDKQLKVVMYTKCPCPFCISARRFLLSEKIPFEEIDLTHDWDQIIQLKERWGWATVPIIIINGKLVGGYMDLKALHEKGTLQDWLNDFSAL